MADIKSDVKAGANPFGDAVDELLKGANMTGVLVADRHGLPLAAKGALKGSSAGYWQSVYDHSVSIGAATGSTAGAVSPTILVETSTGSVLISQKNGTTLAIARSLPQNTPAPSS